MNELEQQLAQTEKALYEVVSQRNGLQAWNNQARELLEEVLHQLAPYPTWQKIRDFLDEHPS